MTALLLLVALTAAGAEQTDDPMIRWDCDRAGSRLVLEMVRPPLASVTERELLLMSGTPAFEQCTIGAATWTLLVDLVEYDSGRCEPEPDTIVSLLRGDRLVLSKVVIGHNCARRPVLSAVRIAEQGDGAPPTVELCAASSFGADASCSALRDAREPVDNEALAARAR